ncbi:MAG: Fic family protein [Kofleriaceae bacterium]
MTPRLTPEILANLHEVPGHVFRIEVDGRYLHWDELRHRTPPAGLTRERWWAAIALARSGVAQHVAEARASGTTFRFTMTDTIQRGVHGVDRDACGRIELPEDITNQATRDRYVVSSLIEEAIQSSQLEGASTTRVVAKEMLRTGRAPRTLGERMIRNNFLAMEWARDRSAEPLRLDRLFELHHILTADTLDQPDAAGRLRRADEPVHVVDPHDEEIVYTPPDAARLAQRMDALCRFANATPDEGPFIHPVVRAILLHFWLAFDHPFVDGNGRVARALFYWSMLRQGYWLTEFISISRVIKRARAQYDRAFIYAETDGNDATYFVLNQLKVVRTAIDDLFTHLRSKAGEVRSLEARLRDAGDLNHRQVALLGHALRQPDTRFTIEAHRTSHRVAYQTARTDLLALADRGRLTQGKQGAKLVFVATPDLERRLERGTR